jgi:putative tryptophan/tyrosine transport system substrate-binding protein
MQSGHGRSLADDAYRQSGVYTGRVLKGERPSDLPIQQSVKGRPCHQHEDRQDACLTFSLTLLGRADEVIE